MRLLRNATLCGFFAAAAHFDCCSQRQALGFMLFAAPRAALRRQHLLSVPRFGDVAGQRKDSFRILFANRAARSWTTVNLEVIWLAGMALLHMPMAWDMASVNC